MCYKRTKRQKINIQCLYCHCNIPFSWILSQHGGTAMEETWLLRLLLVGLALWHKHYCFVWFCDVFVNCCQVNHNLFLTFHTKFMLEYKLLNCYLLFKKNTDIWIKMTSKHFTCLNKIRFKGLYRMKLNKLNPKTYRW